MSRIEAGVMRQVVTISGDEEAPDPEVVGSLIAHIEDDGGLIADHVLVLYTLDVGRLRGLLGLAAAGEEVEGLLLSLDAVSLASDVHAPDDLAVPYDRETLVAALVAHQRTSSGDCLCGWGRGAGSWGASFAVHLADAYEAAAT